jgi:8-oxo-dGTP pyrophosphatase MutT (NUDIX family)
MEDPKFVVALIRDKRVILDVEQQPGQFANDELVLTVSRRGLPDDLGLPGGKIEPEEKCWEALIREVYEETGVKTWNAKWIMDREEDTADGGVARCYLVTEWTGSPTTKEEGCHVSWRPWRDLLSEKCSFRKYNEKLFRHLGWLKE